MLVAMIAIDRHVHGLPYPLVDKGCLLSSLSGGKAHTTEEPLMANGRQLAGDHSCLYHASFCKERSIPEMHFSGDERQEAGHPQAPAKSEFLYSGGFGQWFSTRL
jgi:hypothetical protein